MSREGSLGVRCRIEPLDVPTTALSPSAPTEVLSGLVERVTFHNQESGFCVLRVKARGHRDLVTVVGHAALVSAGEWVTASGEWFNDSTTRFRRLLPAPDVFSTP